MLRQESADLSVRRVWPTPRRVPRLLREPLRLAGWERRPLLLQHGGQPLVLPLLRQPEQELSLPLLGEPGACPLQRVSAERLVRDEPLL